MSKVIFIDNVGKRSEIKSCVLYIKKDDGNMQELLKNVNDKDLMYISKKLETIVEVNIKDGIREQIMLKNLNNKYKG